MQINLSEINVQGSFRGLNFMKSSAESILQKFKETANGNRQINGRDISEVYGRLHKLKSAPELPSPTFTPVLPISDLKNERQLGLIVETRKTDAILFVIKNFIENTGLPVHVILSEKNLDYANAPLLTDFVENGLLAVSKLELSNLTASKYNALFLNERLWEYHSSFDKIIVFQTDSCICSSSPYKLDDFLGFDYIGADWPRKRPVGLIIDGGVGGFSLRDITKARNCLQQFDPNLWPGGEDAYFGFHMELLDGKVARSADRQRFCTQGDFVAHSFACHSIKSMPMRKRVKFFKYCPEALLLNNCR